MNLNNSNRILWIIFILSLVSILAIYGFYIFHFYVKLDYVFSTDTGVWGQFGDFVGGMLNPLLSCLTIVLLVLSGNLQIEANRNLKVQIECAEKTEKLKSFEALFFNLIQSQRELFSSFVVTFQSINQSTFQLSGKSAVIEIEQQVESFRSAGADVYMVRDHIDKLDQNDQIFELIRGFYIGVKFVNDKLNDESGFSRKDREDHFEVLINLTDFSLLRLVMMAIQFMDYQSVEYLKNSPEFMAVFDKLGLKTQAY